MNSQILQVTGNTAYMSDGGGIYSARFSGPASTITDSMVVIVSHDSHD